MLIVIFRLKTRNEEAIKITNDKHNILIILTLKLKVL